MQHENDGKVAGHTVASSEVDSSEEITMQWLIEQEYAEEPEKLFAVLEEKALNCELTPLEAEIAARPMTRGDRNLDDLSTYVREEIVLGAAEHSNDIYARSDAGPVQSGSTPEVPMAIDHFSLKNTGDASAPAMSIDDGIDILGLSEEDDIGEQFLVIKKSARAEECATDTNSPTEPGALMTVDTDADAGNVTASDCDVVSGVSTAPADETQARAESPTLSETATGLAEPALVDGTKTIADPVAVDASPGLLDLETIVSTGESDAPETGRIGLTSGAPLTSTEAPRNVLDYVGNYEPPADDAAFDQYLLRGEHLDDGEVRIEELLVASTEGVAAVDPALDTAIDYHEDFAFKSGLDGESVSAITRVIAGAMDELSAVVTRRLEELGLESSAVQVEVMLGADTDAVACCLAQGYVPVDTVCPELPIDLAALGQTEIDAVYVRLFHADSGECWNDLLQDGFERHRQSNPASSGEGESAEEPWSLLFPADNPIPENFDDGFDLGSDLDGLEIEGFGDQDFATSDATAEGEPDNDDWSCLAEDHAQAGLQEHDSNDERTGVRPEPLADLTASDQAMASVPAESAVTDLAESATSESLQEVPAVRSEVFEDDIFGPDFADDFELEQEASAADVEALFDSLADSDRETDEICGVAVNEFATTESFGKPSVTDVEPEAATAEGGATDTSWWIPADIKFDFTSQSQGEIFVDFLDAFLEEAATGLEQLEDAMAAWEADVASESAFAPIPRILHTLKGIAKGVGLQRYGTLIHNYETLLEGMARPEPAAEAVYFRIIHAWLDAAVTGFEHIQDNRSDIDSEFPVRGGALSPLESASLEQPAESQGSGTDAATGSGSGPQQFSNVIPIKESPERSASSRQQDMQLADEGAKVLAAKQSIRMTPESLDHLLNLTSQAQQLGVRSSQATLRNKGAAAELQGRLSSVRSHIAKIADRALRNVTAKGNQSSDMDALEMDQYSELQEAANILREGVEDLDDLINHSIRQNAQVEALLKQQASVISFLGSSIQAARVVPVSRLMPGLRRIVRTVSSDLGKAVQFRVVNEVGSLDRDNHARCQVILEHMVRNALDHGIESPADRIAAGKPTAGLITIDVNKQGGDYIVELSDDGRGIDPDVMRETAFEKGLDIDVDALSDEEAQQLIFHKGFSTATVLSEISGRGVGMDIVISELQQIGGDIDIESEVGKGTTFRVRIPSNLILNGALLVTAGRASYAIPLDGLIAVEHVPCDVFYDAVQNKKSLSLFGMDCEPSYLATLCHGEGLPERGSWGATVPVIIAGSDERHMAVAIDDVKEALELVIRSLGVQFSMVPGVTGAATTSDGQAIVALDLNALVASLAPEELSTISVEHRSEENMLVLVVDDSRTQRLVATSRFDTLGVETVTAENGMVAMEFLNATHRLPDVVLLDVEMPVKDGIQTLRDIRASSRLRELPVIVTSRTGAKHRNLAEEAGCNGYMGKPFNFPVLVEMIAELTNRELQLS